MLEAALTADPGLVELVRRVATLGLGPDDSVILERIGAMATGWQGT